MNKKLPIVKFTFNKVMEFQYALIMTSLKDELFCELEEQNIKVDENIIRCIDDIRSKLSSYMRWELKYFFHNYTNFCNGIGQLIFMGFIRENPEVKNINDFITIIENSSESTIFSYVFEFLYYENKNEDIREVYTWDEVKNDLDKIISITKKLTFYHEEMKIKFLECLENAEETKKRFCLLLRQFYNKVYEAIEKDIQKEIAPYIKVYEDEYLSDPEVFSRKYFEKDIRVYENKLIIHISFFRYLGSDYYASKNGTMDEKPEWIVLGSATKNFLGKDSKKERVLDFLKVISDKKRLDIIELLKKEPLYVNEIAEKINMSAATTSYHLTMLQSFCIVDFERYNHRFYYHLNKEKLKELFCEAMDALIN